MKKIVTLILAFFLMSSSKVFAQTFNYNDAIPSGALAQTPYCSTSTSSLTNITSTGCYGTTVAANQYLQANLSGDYFTLENNNIQAGDKIIYTAAIALDKNQAEFLSRIQNPKFVTNYQSWYNETHVPAKYTTTQIASSFNVLSPDSKTSLLLFYAIYEVGTCSDQYCNTSTGTNLYFGSTNTSGILVSIANSGQGGFTFVLRSRAVFLLDRKTSSSSSTDYTQLLNTISSQLNTIAGNQVTMNDNMVDYIENARDVISSAISSQTSNINAQSVANTNALNQQIANSAGAVNQQIANSASSINSQISTTGQAISSGISTTNSNLSGISSQLNTIASNQVTSNDNLLDYLDLIIQNQQSSSGTIDYQYQQQTARNTSAINQTFSGFQSDYNDDDVDQSVDDLSDFFNTDVDTIQDNGGQAWTGNQITDDFVNDIGISSMFRSLFARNLPGTPTEPLNCESYGAYYYPEIDIVKDNCSSPVCRMLETGYSSDGHLKFSWCTRQMLMSFGLTSELTLLNVWDMFWWMIVIWRISVDIIHTFQNATNVEKEDKLTIMEV